MNKKQKEINSLAHIICEAMGWVVDKELNFYESKNPRSIEFIAVATAVWEHQNKKP